MKSSVWRATNSGVEMDFTLKIVGCLDESVVEVHEELDP